MKKIWIATILSIVLVALVSSLFLILQNSRTLTPDQVRDAIKPEIENYCSGLEGNATLDPMHYCFYCRTFYPLENNSNYVYNENPFPSGYLSQKYNFVNYTYEKQAGVYNVTALILIAFEGRGDMTQHDRENFILDSSGKVISSTLNITRISSVCG